MKIIRAGAKEYWEHNYFNVICNFNMNCNLQCSYCINKTRRSDFHNVLPLQALHNLMFFLPLLNKERYNFSLAGGEPSLYPHLPEFFSYLSQYYKNKHKVTLCTNGSTLLKLQKQLMKHGDINFFLSISLHTEQISLEQYEKILKKCEFPERVKVNILLKPGTLKKSLVFFEKLKQYNFYNLEIRPIINAGQNSGLEEYASDENVFFKNNVYSHPQELFNDYLENDVEKSVFYTKSEFLLKPELVNYQNLVCLVGKNALRVLPTGQVTLCFGHKGDTHFNLNNLPINQYRYTDSFVYCPSKKCACVSFTQIPKFNPEYALPPAYYQTDFKVLI